jgi:DNA-binding NarL/FixJ family response regulator
MVVLDDIRKSGDAGRIAINGQAVGFITAMLPIRILIVDDHDLVCSGLSLVLERMAGAQVIAMCGDCASATRMVESLAPDIVLMDVELPDGDGITLTATLQRAFPAVKVLVLTGRLEVDVEVRARAAGAWGVLAKTRAAADLIAAVRHVAEGGRHFGANKLTAGVADQAAKGPKLPKRESEVLNLLLLGLRNKEIAAELKLGVKTVETYRSRLMKRFNCTSPAELVRHAIRAGLASP